MADESQFTAAPIDLANGIGANNEVPSNEPIRYTQQQQIDHANAMELAKQQEQGNQVESLLNAASPTPLGKPVNPPIAETLSNLGKIEPAQLGAASIALDGKAPQAAPVDPAAEYAMPTANDPAGVSATTISGYNSAAVPGQLEGSLTASYDQQQAANNAIAAATQNKAKADQAQFANAEKAYAKAEVERAENKLKFDADFNGRMQSYEASVAEYKEAAGEKVMPGRLLAEMATGQRVQAGIFMALSAYGASISGQENQALKVINNAIDKDLEAQKFNLENKLKGARMGVEGSQYIMAQMRTKFGDDEAATLASRAAMLAMTQQQLNVNASKLDQATAGPKAQAMNALLEGQKQQMLMQLKQSQAQSYMLQSVQGGNKKVLSDSELTVMESVNKGYRDRWVQGFGPAANSEQAKEFIKYTESIVPAIEGLERVQALARDYNKISDYGKRKQIEAEVSSLVGALRVPVTGPGVLTPAEAAMIRNNVIGDPSKLLAMSKFQMMTLQTTLNKLKSDVRTRGKIAGLPEDSFAKPTTKKYFID